LAFWFDGNRKFSLMLLSTLIVAYNYQIGLFCAYIVQDIMPELATAERVMGYSALGTLPSILLSALSLWLIFKSIKTKKYTWYIPFIIFSVLLSLLTSDEGYGTNFMFKIAMIAFNILLFKDISKSEISVDNDN
jgi:hypothetical protein